MMVLIFGASSSSTSAIYVLRNIVKDNPDYAEVAKKIS